MGFSIGSNGQWVESFNWKPTSKGQQLGGFKNSPLISEFAKAYTYAEQNKGYYSTNTNYIQKMGWLDTPAWENAFVQLSNSGGTFDTKNAEGLFNIFGGNGVDIIKGGAKGDFIQGAGGNDELYGFGGNDELWGGVGADKIYGGEGRDVLYGNQGNDTLYGDAGNDLLLGDEGDDTLYGGDGDDYVFGGEGNDTISGGAGADRFYLSALSGSGTKITDFKIGEKDSIYIIEKGGNIKDYTFTQVGDDVVIKNKAGTVMATVAKANAKEVEERTQVGDSRFKNYADTTPKWDVK